MHYHSEHFTCTRIVVYVVTIISIGTVYEDVTTDVLGHIGAWQWMVTIFSTALMTSAMFNHYEDMFLLKSPSSISCAPPSGYTIANASTLCYVVSTNSSGQIPCTEWRVKLLGLVSLKKSVCTSYSYLAVSVFYNNSQSGLITKSVFVQWILSCDHDLKFLSTAMICRLGVMFGYVFFGLIADSFGRKKAMMLDVYSDIVLRLSILFCDSEGWFKLLVFIRALLGSGNNYMGLVLICEVASNRWRSRLSMIVMAPRLLASVCMVPLARTVANSETFTFIACVYDLLMILMLIWTPESPQWMLFNNKTHQAETTLYKAAHRNHITLCSDFKIRPVNERAYYNVEENQRCIGVVSTHNTRVLTIVLLVFWFLNCNSWSILYANVYKEDQSVYFLLKILGFVCVIGCLTFALSLKWKMRHLLMINIFGAGVSEMFVLISRLLMDISKEIRALNLVYSAILGSRLITHALTMTIAPRLFAINVRGTLLGCCQAAGQLGAVVGYLLTTLDLVDTFTMGVLDIVVTVALLVLCSVFPDVDNRELPDVLHDMDYFSELSKPLRWATQKTHSPSHEEVELKNHSFASRGPAQSLRSAVSEERAPAQPLGFSNLGRSLRACAAACCYVLLCKFKGK